MQQQNQEVIRAQQGDNKSTAGSEQGDDVDAANTK